MRKIVTINKPESIPLSLTDIIENERLNQDFFGSMTLFVEVRKKYPGYELMKVLDWNTDNETIRVELLKVP